MYKSQVLLLHVPFPYTSIFLIKWVQLNTSHSPTPTAPAVLPGKHVHVVTTLLVPVYWWYYCSTCLVHVCVYMNVYYTTLRYM